MLFFDDRNSYILLQGRLLFIEWLAYHQKVVQFCNQTSIFSCSGNKTLAHVCWVATRAPNSKNLMFYIKIPVNRPGSLDV